ncbi:MAG TPA: sigma-70 family RNA polymerase sigma factor [Planctomycetes bacterium]|nr:sigma-70 family RNA polymerase sigma factor [Fuerstiella sp.]HIK91076.1 sigma-70 family RNA polymerase sigma factor [Planctomycetota bacterium]
MANEYEDDPELLKGISDGNVDALAGFLDVNRRQLMAFISRRLGDALRTKVEVEDIFQDVSTEAIRTLTPEWPGEREPFSWLCHISERKIVDAHRHHFDAQKRDAGKERALDARSSGGGEIGLVNMLVKSMTTPSAAFSRNAREGRLQAAIAELKDDQREAIRLKYIENKPSKEIAEALGKSDAAVRVMLTRTMKQLHELLGED